MCSGNYLQVKGQGEFLPGASSKQAEKPKASFHELVLIIDVLTTINYAVGSRFTRRSPSKVENEINFQEILVSIGHF